MANTLNLGNGNWGVKKDSLLAYNSENNNFKPLPFDFTRASSATVVNKAGLIETVGNGEPRIDFLGNTKGALKLEPQRTNLVTYSEDFSDAFWTKTNTTLTSNNEISPDGSLNADLSYPNTSASTKYGVIAIERVTSGLSSSEYTNSVFVKSNNWQWIYLIDPSGFKAVWFDVQNGIVGTQEPNASGSIEDYGNGWYKCTVNTHTSPVAYNYLGVYFSDSDNSVICTNNGTSGVYIYGAQLEQGSYATSYIPTQGSAVTRLADVCNNGANEQVINSTEGVLYFEGSAFSETGSAGLISLSDGTTNNRVTIELDGNIVKGRITPSVGVLNAPTNITISSKIALKYKENDFALWVNGLEVAVINSGNTFSSNTLTELAFDRGDSAEDFYGNVKDARLYNIALTDSELAILTTI